MRTSSLARVVRFSVATFTVAFAVFMAGIYSGQAQDTKTKDQPKAAAGTAAKTLVDVNSADAKALETLPGIGPTIAQRIIDGRPYQSLDDLAKVKGVGPSKAQALKGRVVFGASGVPAKKPVNTARPATGAVTGSSPPPAAAPAPRSSSATKGATSAAKLAPGEKININTATAEELDRLPGIGPTKAKAIVDYRNQNGPFQTIQDIEKVKGIKAGSFAKIQDYITVR